jgi:hypothetical protein
MKRDMDLAREILLQIEAAPSPDSLVDITSPDHTEAEVSYHVMLLAQAHLIEAYDFSGKDSGLLWKPIRLRWEGHEFLEAARDDSRWERAKRLIREKGSGTVFSLLQEVLIKLATQALLHS